ncbi:S-adenosyl-L-methionine-dependent methyltransferase [Acrodontium crateriforme]|uniref:S-adenosyl-L-methionine-dependent methyltransferase n=1 Tax=Acrodontium crateriforme TaxID=150365 RepID=A0AAQ3M3T6_9PEZI|nr:S-adenosyl-L-methionine-dependent methyltransferase [Acrodontium crateriforme]
MGSGPTAELDGIIGLATDLLQQCQIISGECNRSKVSTLRTAINGSAETWHQTNPRANNARSVAQGLITQLSTFLHGPHEYLHELVSSNWDHGALYAALQARVIDHIAASTGGSSLYELSQHCDIPEDKLSRILGLLCCRGIISQPEQGVYVSTSVSRELIRDGEFRAWVEFQLFETRVASAHLANALAKKPNDYTSGVSAFKQAWGMEMYEWHHSQPQMGERFQKAMRGVAKSLDPADQLLNDWFKIHDDLPSMKVVEFGGRYGFASLYLAEKYPQCEFEVRCDSQDFLTRGEALLKATCRRQVIFTHTPDGLHDAPTEDQSAVSTYIVRNLFWNWSDEEATRLLRKLVPALRSKPSTRILVADGLSPAFNEYPPHIEVAYRRRDVTTMTMHNTKQRSQVEWLALFGKADPQISVVTKLDANAHVCKGLWELSLIC